MSFRDRRQKHKERLHRQIDALLRRTPRIRAAMHSVIDGPLRMLRVPLALLLIAFGFVGFLPVLGFWMIPLGLLLLAIDFPPLRPTISAAIIRLRRWGSRAMAPGGRLAWLGALFGRRNGG